MPIEYGNRVKHGGHWRWSEWSERHQEAAAAQKLTHVSANVPLTKAWVNDVFPTARNPRMATLRCTMAGSFFGIVKTKMGNYAVLVVTTARKVGPRDGMSLSPCHNRTPRSS